MINDELIMIFNEVAQLNEILEHKWEARAYKRVVRELYSLNLGVDEIYRKGGLKSLEEIPGVGESIAKKIAEYIETGKIKEVNKLRKKVPGYLSDLARISGIGAKSANALSKKLKLKSINDLKKAIKQNKIVSLKGFGEKSQKNIADALDTYKDQDKRKLYKDVIKIAKKIKNSLIKVSGVSKVDIAGSLRRKRSTIRDIDLLIISNKPKLLIDNFCKLEGVKKVLVKGLKKVSVIWERNIEVDVRVFPKNSYGAALLYFTGGKDFNIKLRNLAIKKGYKLNEYGLFNRKTGKLIVGDDEKKIFKKLCLKYINPDKRV